MLAKDRGGHKITFQALFYPVTDANFDSPSYIAYQEGYWLTREGMKWFWNNYMTQQRDSQRVTIWSWSYTNIYLVILKHIDNYYYKQSVSVVMKVSVSLTNGVCIIIEQTAPFSAIQRLDLWPPVRLGYQRLHSAS
jgi:acetyl esterase/lipase